VISGGVRGRNLKSQVSAKLLSHFITCKFVILRRVETKFLSYASEWILAVYAEDFTETGKVEISRRVFGHAYPNSLDFKFARVVGNRSQGPR